MILTVMGVVYQLLTTTGMLTKVIIFIMITLHTVKPLNTTEQHDNPFNRYPLASELKKDTPEKPVPLAFRRAADATATEKPTVDEAILDLVYNTLQKSEDKAAYYNGQSQPVIFEPRPKMTPSAGTFTMVVIVNIKEATDEVYQSILTANDSMDQWILRENSSILDFHDGTRGDLRADGTWRPSTLAENAYNDRFRELERLGRKRAYVDFVELLDVYTQFSGYLVHARKEWRTPEEEEVSADPYPWESNARKRNKRQTKDPGLDKLNPILDQLETAVQKLQKDEGQNVKVVDSSPAHSRKKRFLGWLWNLGNSVAIHHTNKRVGRVYSSLRKLAKRDELLDHKIRELAKYLDKTIMVTNAIRLRTDILRRHITTLARALKAMNLRVSVLTSWVLTLHQSTQRQDLMTRLLTESAALMERVKLQLTTLTTRRLTPEIIAPHEMREHLIQMEQELSKYPNLRMPISFRDDVWPAYPLFRVTPILTGDFLLLVSEMPLVSTDLKMDLYRVHNLPAVHPEYNIYVKYDLESSYFAVSHNGQFVSVPDEATVAQCEMNGHSVCHYKAPLYPKDRCQLCLCALYDDILEDQTERIQQSCKAGASNFSRHSAIYLEDNFWAIASNKPFKLFVTCPGKTYYKPIQPPLDFVNLTGGCMGTSSEVFLPSLTQVTTVMDSLPRTSLLDQYAVLLKNYDSLKVWNYMNFTTKELDEIIAFRDEVLPELPEHLPMGIINQKLQEFTIPKDTPWYKSFTVWVIVALVILLIIMGVVVYFTLIRGKLNLGAAVVSRIGLPGFITRRLFPDPTPRARPNGGEKEYPLEALGSRRNRNSVSFDDELSIADDDEFGRPRSRRPSVSSYVSFKDELNPPSHSRSILKSPRTRKSSKQYDDAESVTGETTSLVESDAVQRTSSPERQRRPKTPSAPPSESGSTRSLAQNLAPEALRDAAKYVSYLARTPQP